MKYKDYWSAGFWFLLALYVCIESFRLGLGKINAPRSGFMPFWAGAVLAGLSLLLIINKVFSKDRQAARPEAPPPIRWKNWITPLGAMLGFSLFFNYLGFVISTFALMFVLFAYGRMQSWPTALFTAALTTAFSYLIFKVLLQGQFPVGLLGI